MLWKERINDYKSAVRGTCVGWADKRRSTIVWNEFETLTRWERWREECENSLCWIWQKHSGRLAPAGIVWQHIRAAPTLKDWDREGGKKDKAGSLNFSCLFSHPLYSVKLFWHCKCPHPAELSVFTFIQLADAFIWSDLHLTWAFEGKGFWSWWCWDLNTFNH